MTLKEVPLLEPAFLGWSHADKIKFFGWYLHTYQDRSEFDPDHIKQCYLGLDLALPSAIAPFFTAMLKQKPPAVVRSSTGYRLEARVRQQYDSKYGQRPATIHVQRLLAELPVRIPDLAERGYLEEAITCFKHKAFRAAVVMCWNLAFDHLCEFVLRTHLPAFNAQLPRSFPKTPISKIAKRDDFSALRESEVLQVCASANIITGSLHKVLKEKLDRRNIAAHPSGIMISEATAEEFIKDLLENVVLKLQAKPQRRTGPAGDRRDRFQPGSESDRHQPRPGCSFADSANGLQVMREFFRSKETKRLLFLEERIGLKAVEAENLPYLLVADEFSSVSLRDKAFDRPPTKSRGIYTERLRQTLRDLQRYRHRVGRQTAHKQTRFNCLKAYHLVRGLHNVKPLL